MNANKEDLARYEDEAMSFLASSIDNVSEIVECKMANRQLHLAAMRILAELAHADNMSRIRALQALVTR